MVNKHIGIEQCESVRTFYLSQEYQLPVKICKSLLNISLRVLDHIFADTGGDSHKYFESTIQKPVEYGDRLILSGKDVCPQIRQFCFVIGGKIALTRLPSRLSHTYLVDICLNIKDWLIFTRLQDLMKIIKHSLILSNALGVCNVKN